MKPIGAKIRDSLGVGFRPDLSAVVQDDEGGRGKRTQPGVLTLGTGITEDVP